MNLILIRDENQTISTKGTLSCDDFQCNTLELPFLNNQRRISCIPVGTYDWVKVGATLKIPYLHISLLNVPNRSGIKIHRANLISQIQGCIAVGKGYKDINADGIEDIINSGATFKELMNALPDAGTLTIV